MVKKMKEKYQKGRSPIAGACMQCLDILADKISSKYLPQEIPDDLKWTSKTNRGGLQVLSDIGYSLFREMEEKSYNTIQQSILASKTVDMDKIVHAIMEDVAVNFLWSLLDSKQHTTSLLAELAKEWVLLRIYSIGKKMMEEYKEITKGTLKAKKSLRKELMKKDKESS